jgi:hypothetical protein
MQPTTRNRLLAFAAILAAGVLIGVVVDFAVRRPGVFIPLAVLAYLVTRPHLPFCYTVAELDRYHTETAYSLSQLSAVLYFAFVAFGTWHHRSAGLVDALLASMIWLYVIDRLLAFAIRRTVALVRITRARRRRREAAAAADQPVADDVVDAEVVP